MGSTRKLSAPAESELHAVEHGDVGGRDLQHHDAAGLRVGLQLPAHFDAVHVRKIHIQHHQLRRGAAREAQSFLAGACFDDLKAGTIENTRGRVPPRLVVVDVEDDFRRWLA